MQKMYQDKCHISKPMLQKYETKTKIIFELQEKMVCGFRPIMQQQEMSPSNAVYHNYTVLSMAHAAGYSLKNLWH